MPLKDTNCRNAKPQVKPYRLYDEQGLYLEVQPNGGRYWRLKYRFLGKEKRLALGVYPEVGLQEARRKRDDARAQLARGQDPSLQRRMPKVTAAPGATLVTGSFRPMIASWPLATTRL